MMMKSVSIGFVMAALAFAATLPANAQSFDVETVCEIDFLELLAQDLAKVPENRRTSYFAPVNEGDLAVRRCTESRTQQAQTLRCLTKITGWTPVVEFEAKRFNRRCQMVNCVEGGAEIIEAANQTLAVRAVGSDTVEVELFCSVSRRK